ncbi:hypothetical protein [Herbiconiux sp. A18JL235]|uniref:Uncharacterized protein n=1 Tax=Herbiconiux sp. A18JL235 TaxID=3152363 RepID=A0AB39BHJ2_9MICO
MTGALGEWGPGESTPGATAHDGSTPGGPAEGEWGPGGWGTLWRAGGWLASVVVVHAAVQAALVALSPPLALSTVGVLLAAASAVALLVATGALWSLARRVHPGVSPRRTLGWVVVTGIVGALAAVVSPYLVPVVAALGCPFIAAGSPRGVARLARAHPVRIIALLVVTAVVVVGAFLLSLLLGLFVTGWPAAAGTWLGAGVAAAVLVCQWVALARRPAKPERADRG